MNTEPQSGTPSAVTCFVGRIEGDDADVDMSGLNLVRHHLQQAQAAAEYLAGGESHAEAAENTLHAGAALTESEAADIVRISLKEAEMALDAAQTVGAEQ